MSKKLDIGSLRHRVTVQQRTSPPTRDSFGEPIQVWSNVAGVWASVEPLTGRELFQAQQVRADLTHRIALRGFAGLNAAERILWGSRVFNLLPPTNPGERGGTTLVEALAVEEL